MRASLLLILLLAAAPLRAADEYSVRFSSELDSVSVRACFDGKPPRYLQRAEVAHKYTIESFAAPSSASRLWLNSIGSGKCVEWRVDLEKAAARKDYRLALPLGKNSTDGLLSRADLWFWRDNEEREIIVNVDLPEGISFSTPWKPVPGQPNRYKPARTPATWSSQLAVGRFAIQQLDLGNTQLRVATVGDVDQAKRNELAQWIQHTAESVRSVSGKFPQSYPQILLVGIGAQREPVPWAHVVRGGGISAQFYIDANRPIEEFYADWTATHELSHMLLPYVTRRDRWFSEGLASYYQNVLRARTGDLTAQQAWEKLDAGFKRGERSSHNGTMRVYWTGAALLLKADSELRALSNGRQSLDSALATLQSCCMAEGVVWRAREVFQRLDRATGTTVFSDIYRAHAGTEDFPKLDSTYAQLGIQSHRGRVRLEKQAPWIYIRQQIMHHTDS